MQQNKFFAHLLTLCFLFGMSFVYAETTSMVVPVYMVAENGHGRSIGTVTLEDSFCGVLVTPNLHGLPPGLHGFHVHMNPDCSKNGMAAGGHLDPDKTDMHDGPFNKHGHLGDLPVLIIDKDGNATSPVLAPKFKLSEIIGHSIMIHAGGDNYSDHPEKLGGGGARIACGVIKTG